MNSFLFMYMCKYISKYSKLNLLLQLTHYENEHYVYSLLLIVLQNVKNVKFKNAAKEMVCISHLIN